MATITLPLDINVTPGGTWAIVSETSLCSSFVSVSGNILTVTEPVTTSCNIVLSYTVGTAPCQVISTHEVQITPKTCVVDGGIADPSDWQLNLAPLTINGVSQDNFLYAIVPENDDCATWDNAVAWGYKGTPPNCPKYVELTDILSTDTTPKTNFNDPLPITTFQVPAGDYKLVVVCSEYTLGTCEKIDCCGVNVTVTDLDLCGETELNNGCNPVELSYNTSENFTIYIPMTVTADRCVRMEFDAGTQLADRVSLEVNTGTIGNPPIWTSVDLTPSLGFPNNYVESTGIKSIVVKCDIESSLSPNLSPYMPLLPDGSLLVGGKYQLRWTISRNVTNTNDDVTIWSAAMSCCNCLDACPDIKYPCITNVDIDVSPTCASGCQTYFVEGNHGYTVDELLSFVAGNCNSINTCLGTQYNQTYSQYSMGNSGGASSNTTAFKQYLTAQTTQLGTVSGTQCNLSTFIKTNNHVSFKTNFNTIANVQGAIEITFGLNDNGLYESCRDLLIPYFGALYDRSNIFISFARAFSPTPALCDDNNNMQIGNLDGIPLAIDGSDVTLSTDDFNRRLTFLNVLTNPSTTCENRLSFNNNNSEIIKFCPTLLQDKDYSSDLFKSYPYFMAVSKYYLNNDTSVISGGNPYNIVCDSLYQLNMFVALDTSFLDRWLLVKVLDPMSPTPCSGSEAGNNFEILQMGSGVVIGTSYAGHTALTTCSGWFSTGSGQRYIVTPNTKVGNGTCYTG